MLPSRGEGFAQSSLFYDLEECVSAEYTFRVKKHGSRQSALRGYLSASRQPTRRKTPKGDSSLLRLVNILSGHFSQGTNVSVTIQSTTSFQSHHGRSGQDLRQAGVPHLKWSASCSDDSSVLPTAALLMPHDIFLRQCKRRGEG